jgi:hypothetical protein
MQNLLYLTISVLAVGGIWFVWDLGWKKVQLDSLRERLFALRFELFKMGESGELPFDSEAYRSIETLLCGLLQFSHRVTFISYVLSYRERRDAIKCNEYVDYSQQIDLKVSRTEPATQQKLRAILSEIHQAITIYMALSSLLFLASAAVLVTLRTLNLFNGYSKREISAVLESEAYRAESYRQRVPQTAIAY